MKATKTLIIPILPFLCACIFDTRGVQGPTTNGKDRDGISSKWTIGDSAMEISIGSDWSFFSFEAGLSMLSRDFVPEVYYECDSGHFSYKDSTGQDVSFVERKEGDDIKAEKVYYFRGGRKISVCFDTLFLEKVETAKYIFFWINGLEFRVINPANYKN